MNTLDFTPEELAAFRAELFQGFTDTQFDLAISECKRRNLVPGQHVYFQLRNSKEWDASIGAAVSTKKLTKVTTIDALRLISQRTGEYEGQGKAVYTYLDSERKPTIQSTIPLPHPTLDNTPQEPWSCHVPIYRKGFKEPVEVECRFDAYAVTRKSGDKVILTDMWVRRGPEQLAKCSEAASRRVAFAEELGSMYLSEEFQKEDSAGQPDAPPVVLTEAPKAAVVPTVNHAPATPTDEPRPGEEKTRTKKNVKDVKIEDVILDKVEIVSNAVVAALEVVAPVVEAAPEPVVQKMDESNPLPTVDEGKLIANRVRKLIAEGSDKELLRAYIIKEAGVEHQNKVPKASWEKSLTKLEGLMTSGGKQAVTDEMKF